MSTWCRQIRLCALAVAEAVELIEETLVQEKATDAKLSSPAESEINPDAEEQEAFKGGVFFRQVTIGICHSELFYSPRRQGLVYRCEQVCESA